MGGKRQPFQVKAEKNRQEGPGEDPANTTKGELKKSGPNLLSSQGQPKINLSPYLFAQNTTPNPIEVKEECFSPFSLLRITIAIFLIQILLELGILLLQYIQEQLSLTLFCALLCLGIFFHLLVLYSIPKLRNLSPSALRWKGSDSRILPETAGTYSAQQCSTLQKIQKHFQDVENKKTTKVKPCSMVSPTIPDRVTVKKIHNKTHNFEREQSTSSQSQLDDLKMFLAFTVLDSCYQAVMSVLCFLILENPCLKGLTGGGILSLSLFLVLGVSSYLCARLFSVQVWREESEKIPEIGIIKFEKQQIISEEIKVYSKCQDKLDRPPTTVSIQQRLRQQKQEFSHKKVVSIDNIPQKKEAESNKMNQIKDLSVKITKDGHNINEKEPPSPSLAENLDDIVKEKNPKSVLKVHKSYKSHFETRKEHQLDDNTRKVGMNFKRNEYFEYDRSSAHSGDAKDTSTRNNCRMKSKYAPHRHIHDVGSVVTKGRNPLRQKSKSVGRSVAEEQLTPDQNPYFC